MKSKLYFKILLIFGLSFLCSAQSIDDKNEKSIPAEVSHYAFNYLNGHRFIPTSFIRSPFITTFLSTKLGFGQTSRIVVPPILINDTELFTLRGDLVYIYLCFEYQNAVKEWMAFFLKMDVVNRMGNELQALLSQGVNLKLAFEFGWQLRLYKTDNMILSGLLKLNNSSYTIIDFYKFAQGIIEDGTITPQNRPINETPAMVASAGFSYAYTINRMFGLTTAASMGYGESAERFSEDEWMFDYGLSADADLRPDYSVPIGFTLSYCGVTRGKGGASVLGNPNSMLFQINYTGKSDIDLSLAFNYLWYYKQSIDQTVDFTNIYFDIKYYF